jgi:carbon monoxide dehydrogenase subunit G
VITDLRNEIRVDATPDEAWAVVGDLAAADRWVPGVVSARVDSGTRVCTLADGSQIHEEITGYSPEQRRYSYAHTEHPMPLERSTGTLSVVPDGEGSRVVWDATVEVSDPGLATMLETGFREAMQSLAARLQA